MRSRHVLFVWVVCSAVLLAGCTSPENDVGDGSDDTGPKDETGDDGNDTLVMQVPELQVGDAWSYVAEGFWDQVEALTIVVASHDESGTLFAASESTGLDDEVAWDLSYLGWTDDGLRALRDEAYGGGPHGARLLDFPLEPGKTWNHWSVELTAQPANVSVLGESLPGYRIEGETEARRVEVEYAPEVGYITFYEEYSKGLGEALWSLSLTGTAEGQDWVWFERADEVVTESLVEPGAQPPAGEPQSLAVEEEDDEVLVWAIGSPGSRGTVTPPSGKFWMFEGGGETNVERVRFQAEPGEWLFTGVQGVPDGYVYMQGHALRFEGPGWADA